MSISEQIVSEIVAQLCLENSIQTLLNYFWVDPPKKLKGVCMEFSEYNRLTSQRQFAYPFLPYPLLDALSPLGGICT